MGKTTILRRIIIPLISLFLTTPTSAGFGSGKKYDLFKDSTHKKVIESVKKAEAKIKGVKPPVLRDEDIDYDKIANNIMNLKELMTEKYAIADGIGMGMYIMRYFAELGRHDLSQKELYSLVTVFEKLTGKKLEPISMAILEVLEKVSFNQTDDGTFYIKATTFKKDGATVILHKPGEPGATVTELTSLYIKNGSMIIFNDIESKKQKKGMVYSVQKKMKFIGLPGIMESELNQVHPDLFTYVEKYSKDKTIKIIPMSFWYEGISVLIQTTSLLGEMNLQLTGGISMPGIMKDDQPLPSLVLRAETKMLSFKLSVDK